MIFLTVWCFSPVIILYNTRRYVPDFYTHFNITDAREMLTSLPRHHTSMLSLIIPYNPCAAELFHFPLFEVGIANAISRTHAVGFHNERYGEISPSRTRYYMFHCCIADQFDVAVSARYS